MTHAATAESSPSRARSWNVVMAAAPGELDLHIPASAVQGVVPRALRGGRLLGNGPGWTKVGDRIAHPFDGHGYVRAFALDPDGGCQLRTRFVRTPSYLAEAEAGHLVHRGFATNLGPPFWRNIGFGTPRNVANTTILRWGDQLLAGWEAGAPYALDAQSLATRGEEHFGGALAGQATLAHFKHDVAKQRLVSCSIRNGRQTRFTFREIDPDGRVPEPAREAAIDGMVFAHDFAITPSWYVLGGNPMRLKPVELAKMLLGTSTLLRSVEPDLTRTQVLHLVPRSGTGAVRTVTLPGPAFVVHFGNAFERNGEVVVDVSAFPRFTFGQEFGYTGPQTPFDPGLPDARGPQRLLRIRIPAGSDTATWAPLTAHGVDFPRFHPEHEGRETPALFGATRLDTRFSDPFDSLIRVDLHDLSRPPTVWTAPRDVFVGEPIFAPDAEDEAGGHVLAILSDGVAGASTLAIFDALALDAGPVAAIPLPLLPVGFHGAWDGASMEG